MRKSAVFRLAFSAAFPATAKNPAAFQLAQRNTAIRLTFGGFMGSRPTSFSTWMGGPSRKTGHCKPESVCRS